VGKGVRERAARWPTSRRRPHAATGTPSESDPIQFLVTTGWRRSRPPPRGARAYLNRPTRQPASPRPFPPIRSRHPWGTQRPRLTGSTIPTTSRTNSGLSPRVASSPVHCTAAARVGSFLANPHVQRGVSYLECRRVVEHKARPRRSWPGQTLRRSTMDSLAAGLAATSLSDPAEQSAAAAAGGGGGPDSDYLRHVMRAVEGADATIRSQVRNHLVPPPSSPDLLLACNSERVLFRSMRVLNCEFGHFTVAL
jgi:hypothetical protein